MLKTALNPMLRTCICALVVVVACNVPARGEKPGATLTAHAWEVLRNGAADRDPDTRRQVALALSLGRASDPVIALMEGLVKDGDHLVRLAALDTIGELGDRRLARVAGMALNDDVPEVMFAAARALHRLHVPEGNSMLLAIVEKEQKAKSNPLRAKFRDTVRRIKTPRSALFFAVEQGVGFVPVPGVGEGVSAMSALLNDESFSPRATALLLLATEPLPEVRTAIEQAFMDDDWSVRATAVQLVTRPGNAHLQTRLIPLLDDSSKKVRFRAAAAYLRVNRLPKAAPKV
ncbi:MAG: lyase domain protein repeat-containing protein [Bryobacterales bacterium]|jgi:HEAT repeat protein|nr:lyase domain protein repeat-containing protein [Bryobacterales bacterium]